MSRLIVHRNHLPYALALAVRSREEIDLVVIHCTELPDLAMARVYGERILYPTSSTGNSGHYYIGRSGRVEEWVPIERTAHHVRGFNGRSVGIELVNLGRYPRWFDSQSQAMTQPYTPAQIDSLTQLLRRLQKLLPALRWITGHETLDTATVAASDDAAKTVSRKRDPGPLFPWSHVLQSVALEPLCRESCTSLPPD